MPGATASCRACARNSGLPLILREVYWRQKARDEISWGVTLPSGRLVSRIGDGDVPGPEEDDCKGHVPLLAAESEKEISYLVR